MTIFSLIALRLLKFILVVVLVGVLIGAVQYLRLHDFGAQPLAKSSGPELTEGVEFVQANGVQFAYIEASTGPLVLLLHGYPETARSWKAVQDQLAAEGYRTVAIFMRGYAPSSLGADYSVRTLGQDVTALIEALGEQSAIVVGHDWGAIAAYEAAFIAPEKVSHLITLSIPHPRGITPSFELLKKASHFLYYQLPSAERLVWSDDFSHIRRIYEAWSPGFEMPEDEFEDMKRTMRVPGVIAATLDYYHAFSENGEDNAEMGPTDDIIVPTLVIAGDNDGASVLDNYARAETAFTGGYTFALLKNTGHFPQTEQPRQVVDLVLDFLNQD